MKRPAIIILSREQHECEWLGDLIFPTYSFISTADCLRAYRLCKNRPKVVLLIAPSLFNISFVSSFSNEMPNLPIIGLVNDQKDAESFFQAVQSGIHDILINPDRESLIKSINSAYNKRWEIKFKWPFSFKYFPKTGRESPAKNDRYTVKNNFYEFPQS